MALHLLRQHLGATKQSRMPPGTSTTPASPRSTSYNVEAGIAETCTLAGCAVAEKWRNISRVTCLSCLELCTHRTALSICSLFDAKVQGTHGISPGSAPQNAAYDQSAAWHDDYRTTLRHDRNSRSSTISQQGVTSGIWPMHCKPVAVPSGANFSHWTVVHKR